MDRAILSRCENEALHLSGAIQPHGTLFVLEAEGLVSHVAANVASFFRQPPEDWLDRPLPGELRRLAEGLGKAPGSRMIHVGRIEGAPGLLDVVASRGPQGSVVLEFFDHAPGESLHAVSAPPDTPQDDEALAAARQRLVEEIAALCGFQRVMFYLFREEGDGEVVAEARDPAVYGSYLGLRFPASDIPQIARALYLKNPWRMIPDATLDPVPLVGRTPTPPDLTWSDLRSVSPVHRVYLANMGVVASLSFPVIVVDNLHALVAAHHASPRRLPLETLEAAAQRVRSHAFACASYQSQRRMRLVDGLQYRFGALTDLLRRHGALESAWPELSDWLLHEFAVDGALLVAGERCLAAGVTFEPATLAAVETWFAGEGSFVLLSDSLKCDVPHYPLSAVAGAIALRLGGGQRLYLTRCEYVHEVAWGGNPEKPVEYHDGALGIAPRRSFEKWIEKRLGHCRPWDNEARLLALRLRELLLSPPIGHDG